MSTLRSPLNNPLAILEKNIFFIKIIATINPTHIEVIKSNHFHFQAEEVACAPLMCQEVGE